jgi:hypothetical protein
MYFLGLITATGALSPVSMAFRSAVTSCFFLVASALPAEDGHRGGCEETTAVESFHFLYPLW